MTSLKFNTVKAISELSKNDFQKIKHGIYILGFIGNQNEFKPYYAGKSMDIYSRIHTHIGHIKGGLFTLYSLEVFLEKDFTKNKKPIYQPINLNHLLENFDKTAQNIAEEFIQKLHITWATSDSPDDNRNWEKGVRNKIEEIIGKNVLISSIKGEVTDIKFNKNISFGFPLVEKSALSL